MKVPVRVDASKRVGAIPPVDSPTHDGGAVVNGAPGSVGSQVSEARPGAPVKAPGDGGGVGSVGSQVSEARPGAPASAPGPGEGKEKAKDGKAESEEAELDVSGFTASPDGTWVAVVASDPETAGEKRQKDAKADAAPVDQDAHGERLYLLEVADGQGDGRAERCRRMCGG